MDLTERIVRDASAATAVRQAAEKALYQRGTTALPVNLQSGPTEAQRKREEWTKDKQRTFEGIASNPFHAMIEVLTEVTDPAGRSEEKLQLWYANESSVTNEVFVEGGTRTNVLAWTHPGVQIALSAKLNEFVDISAGGYRLSGVKPRARARFAALLPEVSGLYEPGGSIRPMPKADPVGGLKAVKLNMTADQVKAFVSRMTGLMIVTGAPGSGKTTVAFQRIRFLFDQQTLRSETQGAVPFSVERTRVFLANPNLVAYSRKMLVDQLGIPDDVVASVEPFVQDALGTWWAFTDGARPRQRRLVVLEQQARRAYFGLCRADMLPTLWRCYERQIGERLSEASESIWTRLDLSPAARRIGAVFARSLKLSASLARENGDPLASAVRMDGLYKAVGAQYEAFRQQLDRPTRDLFDETFQHALFHIYDPLSAVAAAFRPSRMEGGGRIARGTGHQAREAEVLDAIEADWVERRYGPEEQPWLAWLLRFALPEIEDAQGQGRFRQMPGAFDVAGGQLARWTHVALDEAQDLSVAEASLITSFVHPDGAVTVSADFRQAVTPTKGMEDALALSAASPLRDKRAKTTFRFGRNMRQSKQIGRFLQGFHEAAFGEVAPFDVNPNITDTKPRLLLAPTADQPRRIAQLLNVLRRSDTIRSVAILQINENEEELNRLRVALEKLGAILAPPFEAVLQAGVVTTSVERIKGLEFDACIVLGLENAERATLNFTLNRAYVALSRPARRLAMVCEHTPSVLRRMDTSLYDIAAQ